MMILNYRVLDRPKRQSAEELMPSLYGAGEDSWGSIGLQGHQTSQYYGKSTLNIPWKDLCWSWNSSILVIWCEQLTHWKSPWCRERLRAEGEEGIRWWDGWMASLIQWTLVWVDSGSWWWTGRPGVLWFVGLQSRTQLSDWTELNWHCVSIT